MASAAKEIPASGPRPDDQLLTYNEAAEFLNTTVASVRWLATNKSARHPLMSIKVEQGAKRPARFFKVADLKDWMEVRDIRKQRKGLAFNSSMWPPTPKKLIGLLSLNGSMPTPDAKHFPDNGKLIPPYTGLSGRLIQPAWRNCFQCGKRFITPDRQNIHSHANCYKPGDQ